MSLYRFFAKSSGRSDLPDPSGTLSDSLSPAAIKAANEAVESVQSEAKGKRRGSYAKFTPERQAAIAKYASIHGNQAAVRHFSKDLDVPLKVTSVQTWKMKYLAELKRKQFTRAMLCARNARFGRLTIRNLEIRNFILEN